MGEIDTSRLVRLAFWAKGMTQIDRAGMSWPGFSYTDPERARMASLGDAVEDGAYGTFKTANAVVFIAIAALCMVGVFLPLASLMFPVAAETRPLPFALLLAACALLCFGVGLPISMRAAAAFSADDGLRARIAAVPGDAALAAKVRHQITRIVVIMCGVLVPGILLFIAFDIQGGPIITVLKWIGFGLVALSVAHTAVRRPG